MADRSLRGMRLGYQSMQSEEGVEFADRVQRQYLCPDGTTFTMTFAADAEIPEVWENPRNGIEGVLLDEQGNPVTSLEQDSKPGRTHWDMLLERRSREDLEVLLQGRLDYLRSRRGQEKIGA